MTSTHPARPGTRRARPGTRRPVNPRRRESAAPRTVLVQPKRSFQGVWRAGALASLLLVAAVVVAVGWANLGGYEAFWTTPLGVRLGPFAIEYDLRTWVNSGLMTLFFLAVGLEARREFDLGDLRERRRLILPLTAGLLGMAVPVAIYLAVNHGLPTARAWGVAMSTDTALALGVLTLLAKNAPKRVRTFLLTVFVVDDLAALVIIGALYSGPIAPLPAALAVVAFVGIIIARRFSRTIGRQVAVILGIAMWFCLLLSGIDPVVSGLAIGLATTAYVPLRTDLERATGLVRQFREMPTPQLAHSATTGLTDSLSENERILFRLSPWTSYVVVPIFALANAGVVITPELLARAAGSAVTIGIVLGYIVGKPISLAGTAWVLYKISGGRIRPQVGWLSVIGSGTAAGVGFTVSLLVASIALNGSALAEAKIGIFLSVVGSALLTWAVFKSVRFIPSVKRTRALVGSPDRSQDLLTPVDSDVDHIRGTIHPAVTLVEYGDFECGYCGRAAPTAEALLERHPDLAFVWRHLPLSDVHPNALRAAEATEAAGAQGAFWQMHDMLMGHQDKLSLVDLESYAVQIGIDPDRFMDDLRSRAYADRVSADIRSADQSGAAGTPTYFINGQRHEGPYDIESLSAAINTARAHTLEAVQSEDI